MTRKEKIETIARWSNEELMEQYEVVLITYKNGDFLDKENFENFELVKAETMKRMSR